MSGSRNSREKTCCGSCCTFFISLGFFVLIYWAIFQPHQIRATVDSAALSNLTVSNASSAVSYLLAVNLSLYNPSKRVNIYYDTLDAELRFRDAVLGPAASAASPTEFYQSRKSGDVVKLEFDGRGVSVAGDVARELENEMKGEAPVSLELDVDVRVRYVFGSIKIRQKPRIRCALSIPVKAEGRGAGAGGAVSSGDRCSVKY
ncbi:NDR1/HIN1-like protein 3 [Phragmites australis]|uniref:NDR1/HIN1-like protein 3 n=1 Tax=Phragmites australis TaxID=29695 RepID=UPI002D7968B7|nr:NDR1/HIN1-like protein 3 [Phragmites australis]